MKSQQVVYEVSFHRENTFNQFGDYNRLRMVCTQMSGTEEKRAYFLANRAPCKEGMEGRTKELTYIEFIEALQDLFVHNACEELE
jgi:hypothetical protein